MGLTSALACLDDGILPESFEGLKSKLDIEWIRSALALHDAATVRNRKLAAEQVVWLIVGMALYRDRPIVELVKRLDLVLPDSKGEKQDVSEGAITPARDRVGANPLRELFQTTARHWALASAEGLRWRGLIVLGADATTLNVADSAENREAFGLPGATRRTAAYPQIRAVALMVLRSHLLLDFDFADYHVGEITIATPMLKNAPSHSLAILDRGFISYHMLHQIRTGGEERHWLIRARTGLKWRVVKRLGRGDDLVEFRFSEQLHREHPELPRTFMARAVRYRRRGFRPQVLLTSLLDPEMYPAVEIAEIYHERWELELGYDEIKTHTLEREETLRSKSPERVAQEMWGLAIAYNLVRHEMEAVAQKCKVAPRRISYRGSLRLIRDLFLWAEVASPGKLPKMIRDMRIKMEDLVLPPRRAERSYPRHVKIKQSHYPRNDGHPGRRARRGSDALFGRASEHGVEKIRCSDVSARRVLEGQSLM